MFANKRGEMVQTKRGHFIEELVKRVMVEVIALDNESALADLDQAGLEAGIDTDAFGWAFEMQQQRRKRKEASKTEAGDKKAPCGGNSPADDYEM